MRPEDGENENGANSVRPACRPSVRGCSSQPSPALPCWCITRSATSLLMERPATQQLDGANPSGLRHSSSWSAAQGY